MNIALTLLGKLLSFLFQSLNLGNGSTWPGHIALKINKHFIREVLSNSNIKIILIAGTNGKTTTSKLIRTGLEKSGKTVIQNQSGANLLNGIASTLISNSNINSVILSGTKNLLKQDFAIFEIDENTLPLILNEINPDYLLLLNLFRDQLDRYGEVNTIANNWKNAIEKLSQKTKLILNADDPQVAYLGLQSNVISNEVRDPQKISPHSTRRNDNILYFGLQTSQFSNNKLQHAADSGYCPKCGEKLIFNAIAFSHLGDWHCKKCGLKRPEIKSEKFSIYPLPGLYNKYNVMAAKLVLKIIGLTDEQIEDAFENFEPAFGRQEIIKYKNKNIQIFLSKNPTSFNQSYQTIQELGGSHLLLVLNDRIPDGRDISWIWDTDLSEINKFRNIVISGDRVYDMALRLKYEFEGQKPKVKSQNYTFARLSASNSKVKTYEDLNEAIDEGLKSLDENETLFILPTYSAMLEVRKILTGKKIL